MFLFKNLLYICDVLSYCISNQNYNESVHVDAL